VDEVQPVNGAAALEMARALARQEGILVGISAGATLAGALEVAKRAPRGSTILCMLPDTGERYLSTQLFADVREDMSDEECALSRSTPNYRFDAPPPAPTPAPARLVAMPVTKIDAEADAFVSQVITDADQPVVLFALEWCEFCWSVRKLFGELGIAYRSVDLDSVEYQEGDRGGKIRAALKVRTGAPTIPQIFVGGEHLGGATDTFDAFRSGQLQQMLKRAGVAFQPKPGLDPYSLLPNWLHPRKRA